MQGDQRVEPIYLRTQLPMSECQLRLEDRVGKPRWWLAVGFLSIGFGRHCEEPLQGTVKPDGFDVAETGARGWRAEAPLIRGRWTARGGVTIMRLQPYVRRRFWAGPVLAGVFCGGVLTLVSVTVAGSMGIWAAGAFLLGLSAMCIAVLLWHHSRRVSSLGRELARRLGVLFEAEPIEGPEGRQLDMHFAV